MADTVRDNWQMACPVCGQDDSIRVVAQVWLDLFPDGTSEAEDGAGHEWDQDSFAMCTACDYNGTVETFDLVLQMQLVKSLCIAQAVKANLREGS